MLHDLWEFLVVLFWLGVLVVVVNVVYMFMGG